MECVKEVAAMAMVPADLKEFAGTVWREGCLLLWQVLEFWLVLEQKPASKPVRVVVWRGHRDKR